MNILHVHEIAGVAGILAKYQRRIGHDVCHIVNEDLDVFRYSDEYNENIVRVSKSLFASTVLSYAHNFDIIHIHGQIVSFLAPLLKLVTKNSKIVAHYYGYNDTNLHNKLIDSCVDLTLCISGLEQVYPSFIPLPLPVNTERLVLGTHIGNKAVYFCNKYNTYEGKKKWKDLTDEAKIFSEFNCLDLRIINRQKDKIPYQKMPQIMQSFDILLEHRGEWLNKQGVELGMLALEALYCGLNVYNLENHKLYKEFPYEQEASLIVKQLDKIYKEKLNID